MYRGTLDYEIKVIDQKETECMNGIGLNKQKEI